MLGAGKYNEVCTFVRNETDAQGVLLLVLGGNKGHGISSQINAVIRDRVPEILRYIADEMEKDTYSQEDGL